MASENESKNVGTAESGWKKVLGKPLFVFGVPFLAFCFLVAMIVGLQTGSLYSFGDVVTKGYSEVKKGVRSDEENKLRNAEDAKSYVIKGTKFFQDEKYVRAVGAYGQAIRLDESYVDAYLGRAAGYAALNQFDRAYKDYDRVTKIDPENGTAYYGRGWASKQMGKEAAAREDFARAEKLGYSVHRR